MKATARMAAPTAALTALTTLTAMVLGCASVAQPLDTLPKPTPDPHSSAPPAPFFGAQWGQVIDMQGTYAGWAVCSSSQAATKSDWVLSYQDNGRQACVYVTGGNPQGIVAAPATVSVGMPVFIKAQLLQAQPSGKPYLKRMGP